MEDAPLEITLDATDRRTRRAPPLPRWVPLVLIVVGIAAYADSFTGPFIFDDIDSIPKNPCIRRLWPITSALSAPPQTTVTGRPVVGLSLALNYAVGGLDVRGYHAVNLLIHLATALTLLGVARRTLLTATTWCPSPFGAHLEESATWLAAATAALWMLHPLQTEAVTYVVQRTELLGGLFYLLTLYCAIRGWQGSDRRNWFPAAVAACALGVGSKELVATAPLIVLLYDRTFVSRSWMQALRRHWGLYTGLASTWLILAAITLSGARSATVGFNLQITPREYLQTQAGVLLWYLRLCFWPTPLVISYDDWPVARDLGQFLAQGLALLALLGGTIWAIWRRPALGFLGAWFFIILAPTSSVIPIVTEVAAERRMYLPLAAVVVLGIVAAFWLLTLARRRFALPVTSAAALSVAAVVALCGSLGAATIARNHDYRSAAAIWGDLAVKRPNIAYAHFELGCALGAEGRADEALREYDEALRLKPAYPEAHNNIANILADRRQFAEAVAHYEEALRVRPEWAQAHNNLATTLSAAGRVREAVEHFTEALRISPSMAVAHCNLGVTLTKMGRIDEALIHLREAVRISPALPQAHFFLAETLSQRGQLDEAIAEYNAALQPNPDYAEARKGLMAATARRGGRRSP